MSRWIKFGLSLLITTACLWWTFRGTHWDELWASLRFANWSMLLWYLVLLTAVHVTRTLRWGNLLSGLERVPFRPLNEASAIGFMMLIILPFRLGEFARPYLIAQRSGIRKSPAMTSVVFERIVDGVVVAVALRVLLFWVPDDSPDVGKVQLAGTLMFAVFFLGLVFLLVARWKHALVLGVLGRTLRLVSARLAEKVVHVVDGFVGALRQLPDAKNMTLFFGWTALYWVLNGFGMWVLANAFDCSGAGAVACEPLGLTLFQCYVALGVLIVGMMIPAAPGSAGTFQFAVLLALGVFLPARVVKSSGVAYANVLWAVQMVQQIAFGLFFMMRSQLSFRDIAGRLSTEEQERGVADAGTEV